MQRQRWTLLLILLLVAASIAIFWFKPLKLGLDLQGGSQLTIQVKTTDKVKEITPEKLEGVKTVIEGRVNALGVSEAVVQNVGNDKILVQLPGVNDPKEARAVLGGTAQLDFRQELDKPEIKVQSEVRRTELELLKQKQKQLETAGDRDAIAANQAQIDQKEKQVQELLSQLYKPTELTGQNLEGASYGPAQVGTNWTVFLRFNQQGGKQFAELTKSIAGTGRTLGIFLDNQLISAATVDAEYAATGIAGGNAEINGNFTLERAKELALQLEGGALPLPVSVEEVRTVGATLGQDSIQSSIYAGIGGLILVLIFMAVYYRLPGVIADVALIIYALLSWATFALLDVVLTLPGIAGFILSIGMAVDANVLIFERTREELREGKTLYRSVESGFYRAFSSILDGNVTTVIACLALFWLGSGLVKGFALTLGLGVAISMFTALSCTRTFLLLLVLGVPKLRQRPDLFCPNLPDATKSRAEAG
ncbi:MAG: protein translocase subunit SecD [Cyanosarcina radialis HA8281-LM2]|jgi:preprotein translocase subunit SecD|nr:protein translocase subunit SecD [Cyanosarcina radialis HA8281-LM2]